MILTVVLGLGSRTAWVREALPRFFTEYAGDILYATLIYLGLLFLKPRGAMPSAAAVALGFCGLVELSQLFHPPWLDELRRHTLVALVIGRGFLVSDLFCYAAGVALGVGLDGAFLAGRIRAREMF